jgi:osmotically-inducible protein OsmY
MNKKTDAQLLRDVVDELKWDPTLGGAEIGVAAKDGVVTLSGQLDSYAKKYAAERAAERVAGVRAIAEDLTVKVASSFLRSDTEIAHAVVNALKWDVEVPDDRIKSKVENGWIWLEGDVEWQYQKTSAERAVRYLTGVRGVSNLITVKPKKVSTFEVNQKIKDALKRSAEMDANRITVQAADGEVTLRGTVRSFAERVDAERAAWAAPGVTKVRDEILISP